MLKFMKFKDLMRAKISKDTYFHQKEVQGEGKRQKWAVTTKRET